MVPTQRTQTRLKIPLLLEVFGLDGCRPQKEIRNRGIVFRFRVSTRLTHLFFAFSAAPPRPGQLKGTGVR